jgi:hypothetical protein
MGLVTHSAAQRDLAQGRARPQHQSLRHFDAPMHQVDVSRHTERAFEGSAELPVAQAGEAREIVNEHLAREVGIDVRLDSLCLPSCQAAAKGLAGGGLSRPHDGADRVGFAPQKCNRARNPCFGHFAIAVQRGTGSLNELRGHYSEFP